MLGYSSRMGPVKEKEIVLHIHRCEERGGDDWLDTHIA